MFLNTATAYCKHNIARDHAMTIDSGKNGRDEGFDDVVAVAI
jgi:hypothetical protein